MESDDVVAVVSAPAATSPAAAAAPPPAAASSSPVARSVGSMLDVDMGLALLGAVQARLMPVLATDVACTSSGGPGILFVPDKRNENKSGGDGMRSAFHNASLIGQYWFCVCHFVG